MKRQAILITSILLLFISNSIAQILTQAEYFFDTDPGPGNGTHISITESEELIFTASINSEGLGIGFHTLFIRIKNENGTWSLAQGRSLYIKNPGLPQPICQLTESEYFIDTDPGPGNGEPIIFNPASDVFYIADVNMGFFEHGFHTLFIRFKDEYGKWSIAEGRTFYMRPLIKIAQPPNLVTAEYFFDSDPGYGAGFELTFDPDVSVDETFAIPVNDLPIGEHKFYFRIKNQREVWSFTNWQNIAVTEGTDIAEIELSEGFSVYPNPSNGRFRLKLYREMNVDIINVLGKSIYENILSEGEHTIALDDICDGIYILRVTDNNKKYSRKIIVSR